MPLLWLLGLPGLLLLGLLWLSLMGLLLLRLLRLGLMGLLLLGLLRLGLMGLLLLRLLRLGLMGLLLLGLLWLSLLRPFLLGLLSRLLPLLLCVLCRLLVRLCLGSLWLRWPRGLLWFALLLFRLRLFFLLVLCVRRDSSPEEQKQSSGDAGLKEFHRDRLH